MGVFMKDVSFPSCSTGLFSLKDDIRNYVSSDLT